MFAGMSMDIADHANGVLDGVMNVIETVTSQPPAQAAPDTAVWGPITSPPSPAVYRVIVHRVAPDAFHFQLEGTPKAGDGGGWLAVMQGTIQSPDPAHQQGNLALDFGAAHALDPSNDPVAGGVAIGFQNAPDGHAVDEIFSNVVGRTAPQPNDAQYHLRANPSTLTFQWVTRTDFDHDGNADELLDVQAQWFAPGAGKASVTVTGGDLGNAQVAAAECWNPSQQTTFYVDDIHANPPAGDPACCP